MRNCTAFKKSNSNNFITFSLTSITFLFQLFHIFASKKVKHFCIMFWLQTKNKTFEIDALLLQKSQRHLLFDKNWLKGKR